MDIIDEEILIELRKNAKQSGKRVARKLRIPLSTLYAKIKKLEEKGIIKSYVAQIDWRLMGFNITAYVLVFVDTSRLKQMGITQKDIVNKLRSFEFVEEASIITGDADIIIKLRARDTEHLSAILLEKIQSIEGISKTKTMVCIG